MKVDPRLVRGARLEAGLSMAQLAGKDMTRQAIFLIERGRARPSPRTLELIAARTGKPASYFTGGSSGQEQSSEPSRQDPRLEELQALCLKEQWESATKVGLGMLSAAVSPSLEARIRHYVGQALVRLYRPDEALEHLRRAQALLVVEPDPWLAAECADWEAHALYLKEDGRALDVAQNALKLCRATNPRLPGTEARILEHIATIHVRNHTYDRAIAFYEEALETAGAIRDLARLGRTYHGLSIAYQERGDLARAVEFTHKALALYSLEHDTALLARGENELGLLLMKQGQMARAEEAFESALIHLDEAATPRLKSHVLLSLAELQMKTGRLAESEQTAKGASELAANLDEKMAVNTAHLLLGQIYEHMGKPRAADREFTAAIRKLRAQGLIARLAESHMAYAELLESRGDMVAANRHWKQAAKIAVRRELAAAV